LIFWTDPICFNFHYATQYEFFRKYIPQRTPKGHDLHQNKVLKTSGFAKYQLHTTFGLA